MTLHKRYRTLRLILGDQLNMQHSWFEANESDVLYLLAELKQETSYVKHHIQKLCAFFSAMENFAQELESANHHILYLNLDETEKYKTLDELIVSQVERYSMEFFHYQRPDEYRLLEQLRNLSVPGIDKVEFDSEHFFVGFGNLVRYIQPAQHNRMEYFYRKMRKQFNFLMDGSKPLGGRWNFDSENREKIKLKEYTNIPQALVFANDIGSTLERIKKHKIPYFGSCQKNLIWPVSRSQSLQLLQHFCKRCLPFFGRYQDAMISQHPEDWTLYHSRLSFSLNSKMLNPKEVISVAIEEYEQSEGEITLVQVEGFVRQILGWREYIRCVYWANMPGYQHLNALEAKRSLPGFFWSGDTKMQCMKQAISQSLNYAYAHHIQRLMITGNFCSLSGIEPKEVDAWYLGVYVDAIEWVEMPNTRGMSQFADGGWVATKPYASGGNYINKMSDYCRNCHYQVKEKSTPSACPFNSLYWAFMHRHRDSLAANPHTAVVFRAWDKQTEESRQSTLKRANWCLDNLESL